MQTASPERIAHFRSLGWWGDTTTWQLFEHAVAAAPDAIALLDPANRESFTTGAPLTLSWGELREQGEHQQCDDAGHQSHEQRSSWVAVGPASAGDRCKRGSGFSRTRAVRMNSDPRVRPYAAPARVRYPVSGSPPR